ncbi:MAG: hypothetical protein AAGH64_09060, partial [Planctomycetota bacterium]
MTAATALAVAGAAAGGVGFEYQENFDTQNNPAGWNFGVTNPDVIRPTGGVSGDGWLQNDGISSFAPVLRHDSSGTQSFLGDWQEMGIRQISLTARTDAWATFDNINNPGGGPLPGGGLRGRPDPIDPDPDPDPIDSVFPE